MHFNDTRNKNNTFKKFYYAIPRAIIFLLWLLAIPLPLPSTSLSSPLTFPILPESNRQENKTEDERWSTVNDYY